MTIRHLVAAKRDNLARRTDIGDTACPMRLCVGTPALAGVKVAKTVLKMRKYGREKSEKYKATGKIKHN